VRRRRHPAPLARAVAAALAAVVLLAAAAVAAAGILWKDNDGQPIPEPAEDDAGNHTWWHDAHSMSVYQAGKVLDLGESLPALARASGLAGPREAVNVNALDGVPDSTWFTNRHARRRLAPAALRRGPDGQPPPAADGPLTIESGKALGEAPGFVVRDATGARFVVKLDPPAHPEMATGAEQVSARIVHALGWHVPAYHLFTIDPARLVLAPDATTRDDYRRRRPMTAADVEKVLACAARRPDGSYRATASAFIPGTPKGPFRMEGTRPDDPNDTVPHEDRRDLRGFRVVAAWINHTDFRPANTFDTFVRRPGDPPGRGRLVHYLLDFSSTLGSADLVWKDAKRGHEYVIDPAGIAGRFLTLGVRVEPWEDAALRHPTLGYFAGAPFDPDAWVPEYPSPPFDRATARDELWGAALVASVTDDDLRVLVETAAWSDPAATALLFEALRARRDAVARTCFAAARINPADDFTVDDAAFRWVDRAVAAGVVAAADARYRYRVDDGARVVSENPAVPRARLAAAGWVELETSHDRGAHWSPTATVRLERGRDGTPRVAGIARASR